MILILDMNLSPKLVPALTNRHVFAQHWHDIGNPSASDGEIIAYAISTGGVIVTCDLDFSVILAAAKKRRPSVIQIRKQGLPIEVLADLIAASARQWKTELEKSAILTIDAKRARARLLPLT